MPECGQVKPELRALAGEELMGYLDQYAGAVSGLGITAGCATVGEVYKNLDAFQDYLVRTLTPNTGYESYAARIVLMGRVIQTLRLR
jgi:hypothetical protein